MVSFWVYDVAFLILFTLGVFWFLRDRREELSREGIIFMWRTQFGVRAIGKFTEKFGFIMEKLKWTIVVIGGILMAVMIWMLGKTVSIYLLYPEITKLIKAPPIAPLIPYFPKLFGMESFFPPFYFTYFIIALAIVAIAHEFSHGVFMKLFKVKIKSTGLVFLGPILGAFVEEGKGSFHKKGKLEQMTILGAGVFANILMALLFYGLYVAFFFSSFAATGYAFDSYAIGAVALENVTGFEDVNGLTKVLTNDGNYYLDDKLALQLEIAGGEYLVVYAESPAVLAGMKGAIIQADNVKILGHDNLRWFLENKNPGDVVRFVTEDVDSGEVNEYDIMLSEHPEDENRAYLGVGHREAGSRGFIQMFLGKLMSFKESSTYYAPTWDGDFVYFIYYLFWWIMVINLLVALFNMMPLGMLDGGRFFYLAVLGTFKSEKWAKRAYEFATYLILFMFALMMFFWFIRII
jgi:membrane-associated protease RseP (regulator of RpoE activity)